MRQCSVFVFFFLATCSFNSFSQSGEKEALQDKKAKIQKEIKLTNTLWQKAKKEKQKLDKLRQKNEREKRASI